MTAVGQEARENKEKEAAAPHDEKDEVHRCLEEEVRRVVQQFE